MWTLTKLIALREILCFDRGWKQFGTRTLLLREISDATGIDLPVLETSNCLFDFSVGRRMSWASACSYDREEDLAYALIGLFGIRILILYGEKHLAFLRLQDEISKSTDDASFQGSFAGRLGPIQLKNTEAFSLTTQLSSVILPPSLRFRPCASMETCNLSAQVWSIRVYPSATALAPISCCRSTLRMEQPSMACISGFRRAVTSSLT